MPRLATALLAAVLALIALPALATAAADRPAPVSRAGSCDHADARPSQAKLRDLRAATLCLVNAERRRHGVRRLRVSRKLRRAAQRFSRQMVRGRFFAHVSPSGSTMIDRILATGYARRAGGWTLGENLAWGPGANASPRQIMAGWMRSPGHRTNILAPRFREIGIGIARGTPQGGRRGATYTTDFGAR